MIFHLFICILHLLRVYYELTMWLAPSWLDSFVGRAVRWYRGGHGFKSRLDLNFQLLIKVVCITAMIKHNFISFSAVQIYDLSYIYNVTFHSLLAFVSCLSSWRASEWSIPPNRITHYILTCYFFSLTPRRLDGFNPVTILSPQPVRLWLYVMARSARVEIMYLQTGLIP